MQLRQYMGALCEDCEVIVDGMTQAEIDADYKRHHPPTDGPATKRIQTEQVDLPDSTRRPK